MWDLADPYAYDFFLRGVFAATLAGALCGLVGVFIVLRGMSYIGHGLSHSIFGGFAACSVVGVNYYLGAGAWGLASALAINWMSRSKRIGADAAIGVVTTASFALGIALISYFGTTGRSFDAALFGSILGIRTSDLWILTVVTGFALAVVITRYRPLLFTTFDPDVAGASGVRVGRTDALLMFVLSLSILCTLNVIGVTLVAATLVIPAVTARMLTHSFARMLVLSTLLGASCGFVGMNLSYHLDVPSGTTIVLTAAAVFLVVLTASSLRRAPREHAASHAHEHVHGGFAHSHAHGAHDHPHTAHAHEHVHDGEAHAHLHAHETGREDQHGHAHT